MSLKTFLSRQFARLRSPRTYAVRGSLLLCVLVGLRLALAAGPNPFQNGSFETVTIGIGAWATLTTASNPTVITGWTVSQGAIDIVTTGQWPSTNGNNSVDLGGYSSGTQANATAGGISQTFLTTAGQTYTVLFDMGGNPGNTPAIKHMNVSAAGTTTSYSVDVTGLAIPNMNWQLNKVFTFVATGASTTLSFVSPDVTTAGAVIDNVRVQVAIAGTVFEDVDYGGGAGRNLATATAAGGTGRSGVRVELYDSTGTFVSATTTGAGGTYSFNGNVGGTYTVRVVNSTVTSGRAGAVGTLVPVQTYRTDASSGTAVAVTDHVGGETPSKVDAGNGSTTLASLTTATTTAQSITTVTIGTAGVTGVDFGFNYDTIVNTNDSGQGSLRQWLINADAFTDQTTLAQSGSRKLAGVTSALPAGTETSIFMVSNGSAVAGLRSGLTNLLTAGGWVKVSPVTALPTISASHVVLDGATQTANVGDTDSGTVGTGGTVGVGATALAQFDKTELEIASAGGLTVTGANSALRALAISAGAVSVSGANDQVTDVLVAMDAQGTSNATTTYSGAYGITVGAGSGIDIRHNYVKVNNTGIRRDVGGTNLTIEYNEIGVPYNGQTSTYDGIILSNGSGDTVQYNLIHNQVGAGIEVDLGGGTNTVYQENSFVNNGQNNGGATSSAEAAAIVICGSQASPRPQLVIRRNIITGSGGPAIDVMTGAGFQITQNSTYANGIGGTTGLGIDIDTSGNVNCNTITPINGVTTNATLSGYPSAYPNQGMNMPVITSAGATGIYVAVTGYVGNGGPQSKFVNATVEVFKSDGDASGYGEGQTYLGSLTVDANGNFSGTVGTAGTTINIGDKLTATATDTNGNTSEFSANFTVNASYPTETFNGFDTATAANAITGVIKTKIAGSAFTIDVVAINAAGTAVYTGFAGTVTVALLDASNNTGALQANGCRASWAATGYSNSVTFGSINAGRTTTSFTVPDAWRDVRVQVTYVPPTGSTVTSCSSDDFAIRPNKLALLAATDIDWATAGTGRALSNTGASGGNVHKAGQPFTLSAQAQNAAGVLTAQYTGTATASLTCVLPAGCTATDLGTLSVTPAFTAGVLNATNTTYSEVGAFTLVLTDTTFAAVDAADSSTAERYVVSDTINVGRFVPDHFALTTATAGVLYTYGSSGCASRSFTYFGMPVGYKTPPVVTVTAQNASNATTKNYRNALWKLTTASVTEVYVDNGGAATSTVTGPGAVTLVSNGDGTGTVSANATDQIAWTRSTVAPSAPITAQPIDRFTISDATETSGTIASTPSPFSSVLTFDQTGAPASGAQIRYGRLVVGNAYGLATLSLPLPVETQYYTGTGWATNTIDNCTTLSAAALSQATPTGNLGSAVCLTSTTPAGSTTALAGRIALAQTAPGSGNGGSVDLTVDLGAAALANNACVGGVSTPNAPQSLTWLQGNWGGGSYTANPTGRATFNLFNNTLPGYRREL